MKQEQEQRSEPTARPADQAPGHARPTYEPPRVTKKRSVARATLFSGTGPDAGGVVGP